MLAAKDPKKLEGGEERGGRREEGGEWREERSRKLR